MANNFTEIQLSADLTIADLGGTEAGFSGDIEFTVTGP